MKKIVILCLILCSFSCSTRKIEKQIVNDFIDEQLATTRYKPYTNMEIILIKEAGNGKNALSIYEKSYNERNKSWNTIDNWVIDSLEIATLKRKLNAKKEFFWKKSDFINIHPSIISNEEFMKNSILEYHYSRVTQLKLCLTISKPLIVKKGYAILYYDSGSSSYGIMGSIEHFAVLMKKTKGKWIKNTYYYDGFFY